ncbi:hypothetical protein AHMF7605_21490 [Adhaeribacter arboris]|uniref:Uncharacterized protein n=1 Tax=Adhaeribacter arboris TaxID=2072846 RepID=A0A2T2YK61_9BACT|nr:hypothetical protein [Adhaeribacter arboris]PSR55890.1 hypothetical protein AHMF7605_21490 [Adhaeribacter arboris]
MDDNTKNILEVAFQGIQATVLIASAFWAYFRFRQETPLHPRIEFDVKCVLYGPHLNNYLATFTITANNKGNVEHRFSEIRLKVLGIKNNEPLTEHIEFTPLINFPDKIIRGVNIVPSSFGYFFVRPSVNQTFNYAIKIPEHYRFILVRATFKYQQNGDLHTAERVFEVKAETNQHIQL